MISRKNRRRIQNVAFAFPFRPMVDSGFNYLCLALVDFVSSFYNVGRVVIDLISVL